MGKSWVINCYVLTILSPGPDALALEQIERKKATADSWQRHEAPSPVWVITPRLVNGQQTGLYLGCQDNKIYSMSAEGRVEWSFDTGGLPSQIVSSDLDDDGKSEVIVASHDAKGTIYLLSNKGKLLKSYVHGMPFADIAVVEGKNGKGICSGSYDSSAVFLDRELNLLHTAEVFQAKNLVFPVQALKAGDVTGDDEDNIVALSNKGDLHVFRADGTRVCQSRVTFTWFMGDLFLVDLTGNSRKEIFIVGGSGGKSCGVLQYQDGKIKQLWDAKKLLTSAGMTIVDDFLPTKGLEVLNFDTDYMGSVMNVARLDANGLQVSKTMKTHNRTPLCVNLSPNKNSIYAGSVGPRDNAYYTIATLDFAALDYPPLPEVNYSDKILADASGRILKAEAKPLSGQKPFVLLMPVQSAGIAKMYEKSAGGRVKIVLMAHGSKDRDEMLAKVREQDKEGMPFVISFSSGGNPKYPLKNMKAVVDLNLPNLHGFIAHENACIANHPGMVWQKTFFPYITELAKSCKTKGKKIYIGENGAGWQTYARAPAVLNTWLSPELKGTIVPIVRNNKHEPYLDYNTLLGLKTAGLIDDWGVSTQNWMWFRLNKHLIPGMFPKEYKARNNLMVAAMGGRVIHFEEWWDTAKQMKRIIDGEKNLGEDGLFLEYLSKGIFLGYASDELQNLSTHAIGLRYDRPEDLQARLTEPRFDRLADDQKDMWPIRQLGLTAGAPAAPLPDSNVYKHLYGIPYGRAHQFTTPYGLIPIVPMISRTENSRYKFYPSDGKNENLIPTLIKRLGISRSVRRIASWRFTGIKTAIFFI